MASGFSLGAAIGATGKFPKLKISTEDEGKKDRTAKELAAIKSSLTIGDDIYHNVYVGKMADESEKMIQQIIENERTKNPDIVSSAYKMQNTFQKERNYAKNQSKHLFTLQSKLENLDKQNQFAPKALQDKFLPILRNATSEEQLFGFLRENPELFRDGYLQISPNAEGLQGLEVITHDKVDFDDLINDTKLFNKSHLVKINETKNTTDKERTIDRYFSVPKDRVEAEELAKTDNTINISNNAFDLGKRWFTSRPDVMRQYKSILYQNGDLKDGDPAEKNVDDLYDMFYKEHIIRAIPKQYENKDQILPRYITNINVDTGQKVAPTTFSMGTFSTNYLGNDELYTEYGISASKEADGVQVELPQTPFIISLDTGKPEFRGTATKNMTIARIGVFPATGGKDPVTGKTILVPLTKKQKSEYDAKGKKYLMYPFALAVDKPLEIGVMPDLSKAAYAIPLYEPDANGNFIIPQDIRQAKNGKGSPLLSQIITRGKWDEESQSNWNKSFFSMMGGVKDQNDIK
jgi:hypothetical protein